MTQPVYCLIDSYLGQFVDDAVHHLRCQLER